MGGTVYGTSRPDPSFVSRVRNFLRPTADFREPPKLKAKGFPEWLRGIVSSPQPAYKKRSAYFRLCRRMVIRHVADNVGDQYWTTDGRLYERHKDGSIRRVVAIPL